MRHQLEEDIKTLQDMKMKDIKTVIHYALYVVIL